MYNHFRCNIRDVFTYYTQRVKIFLPFYFLYKFPDIILWLRISKMRYLNVLVHLMFFLFVIFNGILHWLIKLITSANQRRSCIITYRSREVIQFWSTHSKTIKEWQILPVHSINYWISVATISKSHTTVQDGGFNIGLITFPCSHASIIDYVT